MLIAGEPGIGKSRLMAAMDEQLPAEPHTRDLLTTIAGLPGPTLTEGLEQLVASGSAFRCGEAPGAVYRFKHALVQDTAYHSMLRPRRAALHGAIVAALEADSETAGADPDLLAHHCAEAGIPEKAVTWFSPPRGKPRPGARWPTPIPC